MSKAHPRNSTRDPERTQARILKAALAEFAAKGFAGARVDMIARRAAVNKRMLYHYFGNKEGLFRAVLRRKIAERQALSEATPDEPRESLPYWFDLACNDVDWIRLLEWEALHNRDHKIIDQSKREEAVARFIGRVRRRQANGFLDAEIDPAHMLLGLLSLTAFPTAFPQLTRLITGRSASDPKFRNAHRDFLRRLSSAFTPSRVKTE